MLHCAAGVPVQSIWNTAFCEALSEIGSLQLADNTSSWTEKKLIEACQTADVLLTGWGSRPLPPTLATDPGRVRYVCHLTGTMRETVPLTLIESGMAVTNWGDAPAGPVAETALTLLLACLKNLRPHIEHKSGPGRVPASITHTLGSMEGLRLGVYGFGFIGRRFTSLARGMGASLRVYDPHTRVRARQVMRVASLEELFADVDAVSIHAPLTPQTTGSVTAELLALLPEGGIVINTARGAIIQEPALFAELAAGRLRAGLDVLTTDEVSLPPEHPARTWPNLILTGHTAGLANWPVHKNALRPLHKIAVDNLLRFKQGRPLRFRMDTARYALST